MRDQILGGLGSKMVTLNPLTMKYPRCGAKSSISVNEVMDPLLKDIAALESSSLPARGMHGYLGLGWGWGEEDAMRFPDSTHPHPPIPEGTSAFDLFLSPRDSQQHHSRF